MTKIAASSNLLTNAIKARLLPTQTSTIAVHPGTLGHQVQKLVVDQYAFRAPQQPAEKTVALIFSHCNGFNKETEHPLIRRVVQGIHKKDRYLKTDLSVFAWDARTHGDSAQLNKGTFSDSYDWCDHAMDTLQVIQSLGLKDHAGVIGVGHSFGASAMLLLEFLYPKSFTGICAIDPVMHAGIENAEERAKSPLFSTIKRRDTWPDKMDCYESLVSRSFWKSLHPEVMELYVDHGLCKAPDGNVNLKTSKEQEYHICTRMANASALVYSSLRCLSIPVQFVHGDKSSFLPRASAALPDLNPRYINSIVVPGSHMVPKERPDAMVPWVIKLMDHALPTH